MTQEQELAALREPRTTKGLGLRGALQKPRTMPDPEVDWGAWIAGIEEEARAFDRPDVGLRVRLYKRSQRPGLGGQAFVEALIGRLLVEAFRGRMRRSAGLEDAHEARHLAAMTRPLAFLLGLTVGAAAVYVAVFGWGWLGR